MSIDNLMQQATKMLKEHMAKTNKKEDIARFEGSSGGGVVKIILNGQGDMVKVHLDPEVVNAQEIGLLQDLIQAAFSDAKGKQEKDGEKSLENAIKDLRLPPGFQL